MCIRYSIEQRGFLLQDLGTGFGAFAKIDKPVEIHTNMIIGIGSCFLLLQPVKKS